MIKAVLTVLKKLLHDLYQLKSLSALNAGTGMGTGREKKA